MPLGLGVRLMDHQVLGREAEMLGKVDDVVLEERGGELVATGILRGPGAWAGRQPGVLGRWGQATWRALVPAEDPRPLVLPLDHLLAVDSAVHVDRWAEELLAQTEGLELWLRRHVVARIPGAREGEHRLGGEVGTRPRSEPDLEMPAGAHLLSRLLGCDVVGRDGSPRGGVVEVRARQVRPLGSRVGPLVVTSLVHGTRRLGGETGYLEDPAMGPRVLGALVRWWHRGDVETPWSGVAAVDWANAVVRLRS
jgi:sporulation protein YlmC with PRC-barrel domain